MHCVRGYGHLLQLFTALAATPDSCPPKVMLHSYGGSVEEIPRFCRLKGLGDRFYFSFSHAINARTPEKLAARIAAVPDDRLLIESDQVTPLVIDGGLREICRVVAGVKGWGMAETAQRMLDNFKAFYAGQLSGHDV
uniref:TatD related DNase n=1 Tax=Tetradesmus obliquus TaxID=3088 RepID=A0A383WQE8_TETOB|eukprot:jgi/Sobl393_1/4659/SZX79286.1